MKSLVVAVFFLLFAVHVTVCGQAKAETSLSSFLNMSPSVRANGMGEAGTALIDQHATFFNPGSLGLTLDGERFQLSFMPVRVKVGGLDNVRYGYLGINVKLLTGHLSGRRPYVLNLAYRLTHLRSTFLITTYGNPMGEYITERERAHSFSAGVGVSEFFDIGLGTTFKVMTWDTENDRGDGTAVDLGLIIRVPPDKFTFLNSSNDELRWHLSPVFGHAWCNIGDVSLNSESYNLRNTKRFGLAVEMGLERKTTTRQTMLFMLTPTAEIDDDVRRTIYKYGIEALVYDAAAIRYGGIDDDGNHESWGVGLKSLGLARLVTDLFFPGAVQRQSSFTDFWRDRLQIEFDYADKTVWSTGYYAISISLRQ